MPPILLYSDLNVLLDDGADQQITVVYMMTDMFNQIDDVHHRHHSMMKSV